MVTPAPNPIDTLDFQFKLKCRLKVFQNETENSFSKCCSLLATASRFGLVFVGTTTNSFLAIQIEEIENHNKDVDTFARRSVDLPSNPTHLSINCDCTKLCVIINKDGCPTAIVFDVLSFLKQELRIIKEIRLSPSPGVTIVELDWNPVSPDIMTVCKSDGSLCLYEFKGNALDINELPLSSNSTCFCWSPKGKQIAVGSHDGKITQYKPDLKAVKVINPPYLEGNPSIISLKWVSSFQFIGIYSENRPETESFLIVIDAPKTGNINYTNYYDVCFSYGNMRPQQFYMFLQQNWNVLMIASSNSMEVGVLGAESEKWIQWILADESRAELPLSQSRQSTLPIGIAFNVSTTKKLHEEADSPSPMLLLLSHYGQLCCFYTTYLKPGIPSIYTPQDPISDKSGLGFYQHISRKISRSVHEEVKTDQTTNFSQKIQPMPSTTTSLPKMQLFQPTAPAGPLPNLFGNPGGQLPPLFGKTQPIQPSINIPNVSKSIPPSSILSSFSKPPPQAFLPPPDLQKHDTPVKPPTDTTNKVNESFKPADNTHAFGTDTPKKEVVNTRLPVNAETEGLIAQLVRDECSALEVEFKALLHKGKNLKIDIGSDKESTDIAEKAASLEEFLKALKETCSTLESEVHTLKQGTVQTWAWYDEARARFITLQDPTVLALLKCQPLDPASQRQLEDINHLIYYLDSQLSQANQYLDEQWDSFQDSLAKNIKIRLPTIDTIYGTMVKQNATLQKQKYILKDISNRITSYKRNDESSVFMSSDKTPIQFAKVVENQKKLTNSKAQKLHKFFSQKNVTQISISKPQLCNSTVHLTSLLAAPLSPIIPEKRINTKHDFVMSTPKPTVPKALLKEKAFNVDSGIIPNQEFTIKLIQKTESSSLTTNNAPKMFNIGNTAKTIATTKVQPTFTFGSALSNQSQNAPSIVSPFTNVSIPSSKSPFVTVTASTTEKQRVTNESKVSKIKDTTSTGLSNSQFTFNSNNDNKVSIFGTVPNVSISNSTNGKFSFAKITPVSTPPSKDLTVLSAPASISIQPFSFSTPIVSQPLSMTFIKTVSPSNTSTSLPMSTTSNIGPTIHSTDSSNKDANIPLSVLEVNTVSSTSKSPIIQDKPINQSFSFGNTVSTSSATLISSSLATSSLQTSKPENLSGEPAKILPTSSIFGSSAFSSAAPSLLTQTSNSSATTQSVTSSSSIFGNLQTATITTENKTGSIFGGTTGTLSSGPLFGKSATFPTAFSATSTAPIPETTKTGSIFGAIASSLPTSTQFDTLASSTTSIFGNTTNATTPGVSTNSILGTPITTPSGIFGSTSSSITTSAAAFGINTITTATSIFGTVATSTTSAFEASTTTTASTVPISSASMFGGANSMPFGASTTSNPSVFGTTSTGSIFGTANTNVANEFAAPPSTTAIFESSGPPSAKIFGPESTTAASPFGASAAAAAAATTTTTTSSSIFGTSTATTGSIFQTPTTSATTGSIFSNTGNVFGNNFFGDASTTPSVFGTTSTSPFASVVTSSSPFVTSSSPFVTTAVSTASPFSSIANNAPFGMSSNNGPFSSTTESNQFGQTTQQGPFGTGGANTFSFSNLNVGSTTSTSSTFGSGFPQQTQNPFSRPTEQKSPFGNNVFGGTTATTSNSNFVSGSSLFSKPANPAFGSGPVFGTSPPFGTQSSAFGNTNTFGGGFTSQNQGSFSTPGQSVQQTGFASPGFQKPAASFGNTPVFGSTSPGFGSPPSFGGTANFGSTSTFGNPQKVFGGQTEAPFGNMVQNSTFGNLANQNTVGFGNLAQQAPTPNPTSNFQGGSSFSSWR